MAWRRNRDDGCWGQRHSGKNQNHKIDNNTTIVFIRNLNVWKFPKIILNVLSVRMQMPVPRTVKHTVVAQERLMINEKGLNLVFWDKKNKFNRSFFYSTYPEAIFSRYRWTTYHRNSQGQTNAKPITIGQNEEIVEV